jgi:hypothetical protein
MWTIAVGFVAFAALAMWVISKGGDSLSMAGESHGVDHAGPHGASAPMASSAAAAPAAAMPAASAVAPAASAASS